MMLLVRHDDQDLASWKVMSQGDYDRMMKALEFPLAITLDDDHDAYYDDAWELAGDLTVTRLEDWEAAAIVRLFGTDDIGDFPLPAWDAPGGTAICEGCLGECERDEIRGGGCVHCLAEAVVAGEHDRWG